MNQRADNTMDNRKKNKKTNSDLHNTTQNKIKMFYTEGKLGCCGGISSYCSISYTSTEVYVAKVPIFNDLFALFQNTCTSEYSALSGHTMCKHDNPNVISSGISELDKILVLRHHNRLRGQVQPPATDLVKLVCITISFLIMYLIFNYLYGNICSNFL